MVTRTGSAIRKTRSLMSKPKELRGKVSMRRLFQDFKPGDKVMMTVEPAVQNGRPFRRFYNRSGVVLGKQGSSYKIGIKDMEKQKTVIVHPIHLKRL
ncbi:50S ribosomal protein L21e [Candidatus Woesearchaeota archaeon]|nr:50S ribosomal protein L21e [Candidatus Woesearchaeota archaeon]